MDAPLMHLHLATLDAFNWNDAHEMASFYKSNDAWDKGDEFPLMAMSPDLPSMESAKVRDVLPTQQSRGLYVYDYLRMWCFYLEPIAMGPAEEKTEYPRLMLEFGETPNPLSREPEGLNDADLFADVFGDETKAPTKRPPPEILNLMPTWPMMPKKTLRVAWKTSTTTTIFFDG